MPSLANCPFGYSMHSSRSWRVCNLILVSHLNKRLSDFSLLFVDMDISLAHRWMPPSMSFLFFRPLTPSLTPSSNDRGISGAACSGQSITLVIIGWAFGSAAAEKTAIFFKESSLWWRKSHQEFSKIHLCRSIRDWRDPPGVCRQLAGSSGSVCDDLVLILPP